MRKGRILSILTALALCLSLLPATALAGNGTIEYLNADGKTQTCGSATKVKAGTPNWTDTGSNNGWYVVNSDATFASRITVEGNVHLILEDGCTLNAEKGISVTGGANLTIYGQTNGTGTLNAGGEGTTPEGCAGIGGNSSVSAANSAITINGGVINAYGGENGAGIGGGVDETAGVRSITINGGTVYAEGGARAAGIGSGYADLIDEPVRTIGPIKITKSAKVTAEGGYGAAGIGSSYMGKATGQITISGNSNVTAEGGSGSTNYAVRYGGAGIGSGGMGRGGNILISGGTVDVRGAGGGGNSGAGIGSGASGTTGKITISAGTVTASSLLNRGAGIGNGTDGKSGTFSTTGPNGTLGKAVIYTNGISDTTGSETWSGIVFVGENRNIYTGTVYGDITLNKKFTLESKDTLTVPAGSSLTVAKTFTVENNANLIVDEGGTLTNNGTITNNGTATINGTFNGTSITGTGTTTVWYTVTAAAAPAEGGTVAVAPEAAANKNENGQYKSGTNVIVTATANTGYHFVKWVADNAEVSTSRTYTFVITENCTLTAVFEFDAPSHTHTYGGDWVYDETGHWKECTDPNCPALDKDKGKTDFGKHTYDNAADTTCDVCGYTRTVPNYIATLTVGDTITYYTTVEDAIDEANSQGGRVTLLDNATMAEGTDRKYIMKTMTLDLGGHTLQFDGRYGFVVNPDAEFTLENGIYKNTHPEGYGILATKSDYDGPGCEIIIKETAIIEAYDGIVTVGHTDLKVYGTINATGNAIYGSGPQNTILVDGAELTSKEYGIYQEHLDGGSKYTIQNSSTITVDSQEGWAIRIGNEEENIDPDNQGMQTLKIENSTITGANGIYVEYTDVTISGKDTLVDAPAGYALAVCNRDTEDSTGKTLGELNITGGTFNGDIYIQPDKNEATATATLTISGGKFTDDVREYVVDDMMQDTSGNIVEKILVTSVTLNKSALTLTVGNSETLTATVKPDNATDKDVTWTSDNETFATVDDNGTVTAVAVGTATITVTTQDGGKTDTCTVTVTAPQPEPEKYTVTVSASPAEGGTVSGGGTYDEGTAVTVTATAEEGYHFVKWVEDSTEVSANLSYTFTITANCTLTAVFEENEIPHQHTYDEDAWAFNAAGHWQQCSDAACPDLEESKTGYAEHSYNDEMDTICNVCGYVRMVTPPEPETYTVTILNGGFGAEGAGSYREGDRVYLYAGRRADYEFAGWWSFDVTLEDADSVYTSFIMPDYPVVVEALWYKEDHSPSITLPTHDITVDGGSHGDVEVWPEEAKMTTTVTITALPDEGYEVDEVIVTDENGKELTVTEKGDDKYTFAMPNGDVTIEVTFRPISDSSSADPGMTITVPVGWVNPYTDVAVTAWYYDAVGYVSANGLMGGTSATTFAPESTMNRSMVWTVIARLAGQTITGTTWAEDAKAWAVAQGVSDGTNPDGSVTREELVTMLYRYAGSPEMNVPELGLINGYPDSADISDWAQNAFAWALSTGVIDGRDGKLAAGESITRAEAATILARFHMLSK